MGNGKFPRSPDCARCEVVESYKRFPKTYQRKEKSYEQRLPAEKNDECPRHYTKGNIVLEQFQDGTALLFQPGNAQPFCVATDYDRATASWSYGKYFSDLGCAHEDADPEIIEDASVRWVKEDIREKLKAQDIVPTEFNVQSVIMGDSRLWERPLDREFRDNIIASGNDDLDARVSILKENGNFRSVDTAMPVASLDELEQFRSDRLADKVTSLKDSLDSQYKADEHGRVFDRPCQVLDDGNLDEH